VFEREIPQKASYKGSEVCQYTDTQPYVLQFWASEFPQLRPRRSGGGQPVYSRRDLEVILRIKELLYDEEFTIDKARDQLERELGDSKAWSGELIEDSSDPADRAGVDPAPRAPASSRPEAVEFGSVSRERYDDAVDEIAHLRLRLKDAESLLRKTETAVGRTEEELQRVRRRSDAAVSRLEALLDRLTGETDGAA